MAGKTSMRKKAIIGAALATALTGNAADNWGKASLYYDTLGFPTATLTGGASKLPLGMDFFGFVDFDANEKMNDLQAVYGEFKLSRNVFKNISLAVEQNQDFLQLDKGITRAGLMYNIPLDRVCKDSFLSATYYPFATESDGAQMVIAGRKEFKKGDMYIEGFLDYNFKPGIAFSQVQVGKRIHKNLYGVLEGRFNGFRLGNEFSAGIGLEYKF